MTLQQRVVCYLETDKAQAGSGAQTPKAVWMSARAVTIQNDDEMQSVNEFLDREAIFDIASQHFHFLVRKYSPILLLPL